MTRRTWLASSVAGAGAIAAAQSRPGIAALASRASKAQPIAAAEYLARIEKAQRLMRENRIDAVCMMGGTTLEYFAKVRWGNSERLFFLIIPQRGEPLFVAPAFEEDRAREQISSGPLASVAHVLTWHEDESPYEKVASGLKERGLITGRIAMEENVKFVFTDGVGKAAPRAAIVSATPVTAGCRGVKSPAEVALMRLASSVTLQAFKAAWSEVREGMTQAEFSALIAAAHRQLGFRGYAMVLTGAGSALPHGSSKPEPIREGTVVLIDGGCKAEGYESDISRTMILGKPPEKLKRIFDIVHRAQTAALKAARPGLPCEAVDAAARKVVEEAGYGPGYKFFTHRVGHGLGMDGHEWPYLVKGNRQPLEPHMVFSDEPGIYLPGEFGVRLEDDLHITEDGAELFTPQSPSIEQPYFNA